MQFGVNNAGSGLSFRELRDDLGKRSIKETTKRDRGGLIDLGSLV